MKLSEFVRHGPKMVRIVEGNEVNLMVFIFYVRTLSRDFQLSTPEVARQLHAQNFDT